MSNDEETAVRARLWRLMPDAAERVAEVPPTAVPDAPSTDPASGPSGGRRVAMRGVDSGSVALRSATPLAWPTVPLPVRPREPHAAVVGSDPAVGLSPLAGNDARPGWAEPDQSPETVHTSPTSRPAEPDDAPPRPERETAEVTPVSRLPGPSAFDPGRRGVRVLAVVAVLVVLGAAGWAWRSRPQVEPVTAVTGEATPTSSADSSTDGTVDAATAEVVVAVAGKVRRPGLVRLPAGARLADAVEAAGGALPGVDVAMLNPARKVADGELILVGVTQAPPVTGPTAGVGPAAGAAPGAGARINLNTASQSQLETLPGVGPVLARRIIEHRDAHGGFRSVSDLRQVNGIGDARYEELKDLVTV